MFIEAVEQMSLRLLPSLWSITTDSASSNSKMLRAINKLLPIEFHIIVNEAFLKLKLCAAMMTYGKQAKCF
jgi:hypothetical protein